MWIQENFVYKRAHVCSNSTLSTCQNTQAYFSTKPSGLEVWGLKWVWSPIPSILQHKNDILTSLNSWWDYGVIMKWAAPHTRIVCLATCKHDLTGNRPAHTHTYTYLSSEVQWATSAQSCWLQLRAAQPSPVLTCRIPVSLPEETLASFTSAWEVSPAVFGFSDRASVTRRFRFKRVAHPYHMTRKFNITFGTIWLH